MKKHATKEQWAAARVMWDEGASVAEIAAFVALTQGAVYFHRVHEKWPPRTKGSRSRRDWAMALRMWVGQEPVRDIAAAIDATTNAVYKYREDHDWPDRPSQTGRYRRAGTRSSVNKIRPSKQIPATAHEEAEPVLDDVGPAPRVGMVGPRLLPPKPARKRGELLPGYRICAYCCTATNRDPCNVCDVPMRRTA